MVYRQTQSLQRICAEIGQYCPFYATLHLLSEFSGMVKTLKANLLS